MNGEEDMYEEEPQPAQARPDVYSDLIQEQRITNIIEQTSPSKTLLKVDYMLRGYLYDEEDKEWKKVAKEIPVEIRTDFLQFLVTDLSEDLRMTNLAGKQITGIMYMIIEWVGDYLYCKAVKHNLTPEEMTRLGLILLKVTYYNLLRAQNGMSFNKIFSSLKIGEALQPYQQQKKGIGEMLKFWK